MEANVIIRRREQLYDEMRHHRLYNVMGLKWAGNVYQLALFDLIKNRRKAVNHSITARSMFVIIKQNR